MTHLLTRLASTRLTVILLLVLALIVLVCHNRPTASVWCVVLPLALLALNLVAALIVYPALRQRGLLVLHLSLLGILFLVAIGRLTHFDGRVEVTEGNPFSRSEVEVLASGPWHADRLSEVHFVQGPYSVEYAPGLRRGHTWSVVHKIDPGSAMAVIGDDDPLILLGYRFYTTNNKGFAPVVTWLPDDGAPLSGAIHMPSYPLFDWKQDNRWTTPNGKELRFWLHVQSPRSDNETWTLDRDTVKATLAVNVGGRRLEIKPGHSVRLLDGVLRFDELRMWMGYKIFFDPTLAWLLGASLFAVFGLAWHLWGRLFTNAPPVPPPNTVPELARQEAVS